ncbi:MAG TPA: hypothetical protein VGQ61_08125 [Candidatus Angelobacter sp.]|jgi:hypothetical protein|nr:hypothetical protein [Candidatus Angelobacter sp.]
MSLRCDAFITVMKTAQLRDCNNRRDRLGYVLEALVRDLEQICTPWT